jgi:cytoskeletal protein CcmA (bactofilin family)
MASEACVKEAEKKVVTSLVAQFDAKSRERASQSSQDIHVGPNSVLSGGLKTDGMMIIDGKICDADITSDRLIISHIGDIEGQVSVGQAEISGIFAGELKATDEVIIRPTARVTGVVKCQKLVVHRGAHIECHFVCIPDAVSEAPLTEQRQSGARAFAAHKQLTWSRQTRAFAAGAASVLASFGLLGLVISVKHLLA